MDTALLRNINAVPLAELTSEVSGNLINELEQVAVEEHDYESLPATCSVSTHLMAGAAAGIMEHCLMYPVDSVKTRMQSLAPSPQARYRSVYDGLNKMIAKEGLFRPVRGMGVMVVGAGPAHALYFSCYEKMKRIFSGTETGARNPFAQSAAGILSTVLHDGIMNPAEVIKQRLQMYSSPYRNVIHCAREVYRKEGIRAFYRSYGTQLSMNIPFHCTHLMVYEKTQELFNKDRTYNPGAHMLSGGIAGAVASALTTPLDVCKTLLNTQESNVLTVSKRSHISGFINAYRVILRCCGPKGFFNGLQARIWFSVPSTAISWTVYESFKFYLQKSNQLSSLSDRPTQVK